MTEALMILLLPSKYLSKQFLENGDRFSEKHDDIGNFAFEPIC